MKLFVDSNVLFTAAHNPGGKAALVLELAKQGAWIVASCGFAVREASRNLEIKFPESVSGLRSLLVAVEQVPTVVKGPCPVNLPEKDRRTNRRVRPAS